MNARIRIVGVGIAHQGHKLYKGIYFGPLLIALTILIANSPSIIGPYQHNPIFTNSGQLINSQKTTLPGLNTIDPTDGTSSQALGRAAIKQLVHGTLPWWNHNEQIGAPLAGDMQSAALFPLVTLYALPSGFLIVHIVLEFTAALFTYLLLRKLKVSRFAAILGGLLYGLSGIFAWFGAANVNPVPFLPMLLYGIEATFSVSQRRLTSARAWLCIALSLALSVYAGFPEVAYLDGLLALGWSAVRFWMLAPAGRKAFFRQILLGSVVGILLSLPILVAFMDYLPYANIGGHTAANATSSLPAFGISALVMPYVYGPIFGFTGSYQPLVSWWGSVGGYLSGLTVVLASTGLRSKQLARPAKWLLAGVMIVGLLRIFGLPGLAKILNFFPGMSITAVDRYLWPIVCQAAVILAAFGIDFVTSRQPVKLQRRTALWLLVVLVGLLATVLPAVAVHDRLQNAADYAVWFWLSVAWLLVTIATALAVQFGQSLKLRRLIIAVIITIDSLGLFIIPQLSAVRQPVMDLAPLGFLHANLGAYRFYSLGPIAANYSSYYGLASINTNNIPIVSSWGNYVHRKLNPAIQPVSFNGNIQVPGAPTEAQEFLTHLPNYQAVSVKYLVAPRDVLRPENAQRYQLTKVFEDVSADIYQLPKPRPYFDVSNASCKVAVMDRDAITTTCQRAATLVRVEAYLPGWKATFSDGPTQTVFQTKQQYQGVRLPKGTTTIKYSYQPPFIDLAYVGLAAALLCIFYAPLRRQMYRRRNAVKSQVHHNTDTE